MGSKSTYQLREWGHFAGTIADLAERILSSEPHPLLVGELTQRIIAERQNTTLNSIYTTIYLTVCEGRLSYYIDNEADEEAIALGADGVLIARPYVTAVYGGGAEGVAVFTEKFGAELVDTMKMCGASSLSDLSEKYLFKPSNPFLA